MVSNKDGLLVSMRSLLKRDNFMEACRLISPKDLAGSVSRLQMDQHQEQECYELKLCHLQ
jgi:hypothetical protein